MGALVHAEQPRLVVGDEAYVTANYDDEQAMATSLLWSSYDWLESLKRAKDLQRRYGIPDEDVLLGHDLERFETVRERWG
jgi:hypothetical protein